MNYTLAALNQAALSIGKAAVFYALEWNGTTDLTLTYLGDTEGDVVFNPNEEMSTLKLPEEYGPGIVKAYVNGADPVANIPMFLATPALRDLISPTADLVIGTQGRRPVTYYTLVIFPRELFLDTGNANQYTATISYVTGTGWQYTPTGGSAIALTSDQQRLLDLSIWIWSGFFERPPMTFRHGGADVGKDIETAVFHGRVPTTTAVDGKMVTIGSPLAHDIVIDVA